MKESTSIEIEEKIKTKEKFKLMNFIGNKLLQEVKKNNNGYKYFYIDTRRIKTFSRCYFYSITGKKNWYSRAKELLCFQYWSEPIKLRVYKKEFLLIARKVVNEIEKEIPEEIEIIKHFE